MTSSSGAVDEESPSSVDLEVLTDPVSTDKCLKESQHCSCLVCKRKYSKRSDNTSQFVQYFGLRKSEVFCDVCEETKMKALKSCLVCQTSYCETLLEPHQKLHLNKHKLMDPVENIKDYICQKHERPLELFCRDDQMYVCVFCTDGDHKTHNTVHLEEESKKKKTRMMKTKKDVQQMIQDRIKKIQDIKHSAELRKKSTEQEKAASVELCTALMRSIERCQAELLEMMEEKQKAAEKQDEELIQELQQVQQELKMRNTELEHLLHTEDHLHLLQIDPSLCSPPHTRKWPEISMNTDVNVETLRRALTQLQETLDEKLNESGRSIEIQVMQHYTVDVTLDPDTAHQYLILSDDGKQVRRGDIKQKLPNNPERFDHYPGVLGKEGFSSGRFYFEVQVKGKTVWNLGVARESINRKGLITMCPQKGFWTVALRNGNEYWACAGPSVSLSLRAKPQKVGVFVDYEEGLVSFYDVESRSHICSFTGQSFTENLYLYFCLFSKGDKDQNSPPVIISPAIYT
uniref:E3 ubiquitin-protein ligase TRIM39-like n=1 Tax=Sinocyclocheilus anshuiensis TaxID=1608454 RepID=A0A671LIL6_9TELE